MKRVAARDSFSLIVAAISLILELFIISELFFSISISSSFSHSQSGKVELITSKYLNTSELLTAILPEV